MECHTSSSSPSHHIEIILFGCLSAVSINERPFGIDSINRLLYFLFWSISLYLLLSINLLILHKVIPVVLLILPYPFFPYIILRFLNTFMLLQSANWNMTILLVWLRSNCACFCLIIHVTISALQMFNSFSNFRHKLRLKIPESHSSFS